MRTVGAYLFWVIPTLIAIALSAVFMEGILDITLNNHVVYLLFIVTLIAPHYFKFHKGRQIVQTVEVV